MCRDNVSPWTLTGPRPGPDESRRDYLTQQAGEDTFTRWRRLCHMPWAKVYAARATRLDPEIRRAFELEGVKVGDCDQSLMDAAHELAAKFSRL